MCIRNVWRLQFNNSPYLNIPLSTIAALNLNISEHVLQFVFVEVDEYSND